MIKLKDFMKVLYPYQHIEIYLMGVGETTYFYNEDNQADYEIRTIEIKRDEENRLKDIIKIIVSK